MEERAVLDPMHATLDSVCFGLTFAFRNTPLYERPSEEEGRLWRQVALGSIPTLNGVGPGPAPLPLST